MFVFGLSHNVTVPPHQPRGEYKFSVEDIRQLFLKSMLNDRRSQFELPGGFIIDTHSFDLRQGMHNTVNI